MSTPTQSEGSVSLVASSLASSSPMEVLPAAGQHRRNDNQAHMPVLDTTETVNDDVVDSDSDVSSKTGTIVAPGKEQEFIPNFESRSVSNDASSDPARAGYAAENIAVGEHAQCARRTAAMSMKSAKTAMA